MNMFVSKTDYGNLFFFCFGSQEIIFGNSLPAFARMVDIKVSTVLPVEEGRIRDAVARQIQQFGMLFSV